MCPAQSCTACTASLVAYRKNGTPALVTIDARPLADRSLSWLRFVFGETPTAPPPPPDQQAADVAGASGGMRPRYGGATLSTLSGLSGRASGIGAGASAGAAAPYRGGGEGAAPAAAAPAAVAAAAASRAYVATEAYAPWRILSSNAAFCRLVGHSESSLLGASFDMLVGPLTDLATLASLRQAGALRLQMAVRLVAYDAQRTPFLLTLHMSPILQVATMSGGAGGNADGSEKAWGGVAPSAGTTTSTAATITLLFCAMRSEIATGGGGLDAAAEASGQLGGPREGAFASMPDPLAAMPVPPATAPGGAVPLPPAVLSAAAAWRTNAAAMRTKEGLAASLVSSRMCGMPFGSFAGGTGDAGSDAAAPTATVTALTGHAVGARDGAGLPDLLSEPGRGQQSMKAILSMADAMGAAVVRSQSSSPQPALPSYALPPPPSLATQGLDGAVDGGPTSRPVAELMPPPPPRLPGGELANGTLCAEDEGSLTNLTKLGTAGRNTSPALGESPPPDHSPSAEASPPSDGAQDDASCTSMPPPPPPSHHPSSSSSRTKGTHGSGGHGSGVVSGTMRRSQGSVVSGTTETTETFSSVPSSSSNDGSHQASSNDGSHQASSNDGSHQSLGGSASGGSASCRSCSCHSSSSGNSCHSGSGGSADSAANSSGNSSNESSGHESAHESASGGSASLDGGSNQDAGSTREIESGSGSNDAGSNDARSNDARSNDAGSNDAGSNDADSNDAGSNDGGDCGGAAYSPLMSEGGGGDATRAAAWSHMRQATSSAVAAATGSGSAGGVPKGVVASGWDSASSRASKRQRSATALSVEGRAVVGDAAAGRSSSRQSESISQKFGRSDGAQTVRSSSSHSPGVHRGTQHPSSDNQPDRSQSASVISQSASVIKESIMELAAAARQTATGGYAGAHHGAYADTQHALGSGDVVTHLPYLYGAQNGVSTLLLAAHHGANSAHLATAYGAHGAQNGAAQPVAACAAPIDSTSAAPPQCQIGAEDGRADGRTDVSEIHPPVLVNPSAFPLCQGVIGASLCSGGLCSGSLGGGSLGSGSLCSGALCSGSLGGGGLGSGGLDGGGVGGGMGGSAVLGNHGSPSCIRDLSRDSSSSFGPTSLAPRAGLSASGWGGAGLGHPNLGFGHPNLGIGHPNLGLDARLAPEFVSRSSPDLRRTSAGVSSVAGAVSGALANGGYGFHSGLGIGGTVRDGLREGAGYGTNLGGNLGTNLASALGSGALGGNLGGNLASALGNGNLGTLGRSLSARDLSTRDLSTRDLGTWDHLPNMGSSPSRTLSSGCLSSALGVGAGGGARDSPRDHLPNMGRDSPRGHLPNMGRDSPRSLHLGRVGGADRYDRYDVGRVSVDYGSHHRADPPSLLSGSCTSAGVGATSTSHGGSVHGGSSMGGGGAYSGDSGFDGCVAMMVAASEASAREEEAQMRQQEAEARLSASAAHQHLEHEIARDGAQGRPSTASAATHAAAPRAAAEVDEADEADAAAAAEMAARDETEMAAAALMMSSSRRHADADDECDEGEGGDYGSEDGAQDGANDGDEDADDSAYDGASSGGSRSRRRDGERDGEHHVIIPYQARSSSMLDEEAPSRALYEEACDALRSDLNELESQIRELQSMQMARLKRDARLLDELTVGVHSKLMRTQHGHAPGMPPEMGYGGVQMPLGLTPPPLPRVANNARPSYGNRSAHHGAWR